MHQLAAQPTSEFPDRYRIAIWLFVINFAMSLGIELWLLRAGAFDDYDLLFEADPNARLSVMANGWGSIESLHWALPDSVHPLLAYLFSPVLRVVASVLRLFGTPVDALVLRGALALLVVPTLCSAGAVLMMRLFVQLGIVGFPLFALNAINLFAFSNMIFGSIPDHFALTRVICVVLLSITASVAINRRGVREWTWILLATLASGVTVTNAAFIAVGRFFADLSQGQSFASAALVAAKTSAAGLAISVGLGSSIAVYRYGVPQGPSPSHISQFAPNESQAQRVQKMVGAIGESFAPQKLIDGRSAIKGKEIRTIMVESAAHPSVRTWFLGGFVIMVALVGAHRMSRNVAGGVYVALSCLAMMALNFGLHLFWGGTPFLYSQHWIASHMLLIAGIATGHDRWNRWASLVLAFLMMLSVYFSAQSWFSIYAMMGGIGSIL